MPQNDVKFFYKKHQVFLGNLIIDASSNPILFREDLFTFVLHSGTLRPSLYVPLQVGCYVNALGIAALHM